MKCVMTVLLMMSFVLNAAFASEVYEIKCYGSPTKKNLAYHMEIETDPYGAYAELIYPVDDTITLINWNGCVEGNDHHSIVLLLCPTSGAEVNGLIPVKVERHYRQKPRTVYCDKSFQKFVDSEHSDEME